MRAKEGGRGGWILVFAFVDWIDSCIRFCCGGAIGAI